MPFPNFSYCIICDGIRPEVGGKLTVLGFYGMAPNVEIVISNLNQPINLALVAGFPPVIDVQGPYNHSIVITRPDNVVLQRMGPAGLNVVPGGAGIVGFGFGIAPPYALGTYPIRILVNNEVKLETSFRLRSAVPAELVGLGGIVVPPPVGRPN